MKKSILLVFFSLCLVAFSFWKYENSSDLTINEECSFFMDFYVEDNVVHVRCILSITNNSNSDLVFTLTAESEEDVKTGLLLNQQMQGMNAEDDNVYFILEAETTKEFVVDFQGDFNKNLRKKDRLLPDIITIEVYN